MKVKGKKIILTGAGSGIGKELTVQLLSKGATVIGLDINKENLDKLKAEINNNEKLSTYVVDISNEKSVNDFVGEILKENESIDGLINNAGIIQPFVKVDKLESDIIDKIMNVNFYGPLRLTRLILPELLKRQAAHIVNVSSMGGFFPFPGQTVYGASKAALKLFTEGLYSELLDSNVKVTVVFPGAVNTNIASNSNVSTKTDESSGTYRMLSAKKAAEAIINGMERNKFQLFVGSDSKVMNFLYKINAKAAIRFVNKKMKNM